MRIKNPVIKLIILLPFMILTVRAVAQETIELTDSTRSYRLDHHVAIFIDPYDTTTLATVSDPSFRSNFIPHHSNLTFGYLKAAIWIRMSIDVERPSTKWYLEIPAPFLEYVDFYQQADSGRWIHSISGYYRPQHVRAIMHTGHVIELYPHKGDATAIYIRISGQSPKTFPIYALTKDRFLEKTRWEDVGYFYNGHCVS